MVVEVRPRAIPGVPAFERRLRLCGVAEQPPSHVIVVELFAPKKPGERLPLYEPLVARDFGRDERVIELVRFGDSTREQRVEVRSEGGCAAHLGREAEPRHALAAGRHGPPIPRGRFGTSSCGIDGIDAAVHDVLVKGVLHVRRGVGRIEQSARIRLVLGEDQLRVPVTREMIPAEGLVIGQDLSRTEGTERGTVATQAPRPGVPVPERGQQLDERLVGPAVQNADPHEEVGRRSFRIFDDDVEVAIVVEHSRVDQFVLGIVPATCAVDIHQEVIRESALRILVQRAHVRMRRQVVGVEPIVLGVFTVIPVVSIQPERALLDHGVLAVPQRERETETLTFIRDAEQPVLVPAIGAAARVIVGEVAPGVAIAAVVFAHSAPGALGEVRSPEPPRGGAVTEVGEALLLRGHRSRFGKCQILSRGGPTLTTVMSTRRSIWARMRMSFSSDKRSSRPRRRSDIRG